MTGGSGELYRAAAGLRKAAEAEFTGNAYYQAANQAAHLIEIIGPAEESAATESDAVHGFAAMLAEVRNRIQSELSGNRYYLAVNKLEELACFANLAAQMPAQRVPAFAELAAASTARVAAAAANLGIVMARKATPSLAQPAGTLADGELERRSSEPCLMAELAPPALEPVAPAPTFAEAAAPARHGEAAQSLGSPGAESERSTVQGAAPSAAAAHPAALQPPAPADDAKAAPAGQTVAAAAEAGRDFPGHAAGQKIQVKEADEIKRKEPKTLFKLWLDLAFGRKD